MANPQSVQPRKLACARCGTEFACDLGGHCWCMDEEVRLPLPATDAGGDCLCRDCLRKAASTPPKPDTLFTCR